MHSELVMKRSVNIEQITGPAAAVPAPAANPAPSMESWLPATPIVPGAHVDQAILEFR